jgi:hypothetical protein
VHATEDHLYALNTFESGLVPTAHRERILPDMRYLLSRKSSRCRKQNAGFRALARGQTDSGLDVIVEVGVHQIAPTRRVRSPK